LNPETEEGRLLFVGLICVTYYDFLAQGIIVSRAVLQLALFNQVTGTKAHD